MNIIHKKYKIFSIIGDIEFIIIHLKIFFNENFNFSLNGNI